MPQGGAVGWLAFYRARFPDRVPNGLPPGPFSYSWYGGSTTLAAARWTTLSPR